MHGINDVQWYVYFAFPTNYISIFRCIICKADEFPSLSSPYSPIIVAIQHSNYGSVNPLHQTVTLHVNDKLLHELSWCLAVFWLLSLKQTQIVTPYQYAVVQVLKVTKSEFVHSIAKPLWHRQLEYICFQHYSLAEDPRCLHHAIICIAGITSLSTFCIEALCLCFGLFLWLHSMDNFLFQPHRLYLVYP